MPEGSAEQYAERIRVLERVLFAYVTAVHRETGCGAAGTHRPECARLFEQLGWENYDEYLAAMQVRASPGVTTRSTDEAWNT